MSGEKSLDNLQIWRKSIDFAKRVNSEIIPILPDEEKWALTQQLRRASQSISANIAEGYGRFYFQETIRFCYIARGSLEETYSFLTLAQKCDYLPEKLYQSFVADTQELHRMLNGYIAFLKRSKPGKNEPGNKYSVRDEFLDYEENFDSDVPDS